MNPLQVCGSRKYIMRWFARICVLLSCLLLISCGSSPDSLTGTSASALPTYAGPVDFPIASNGCGHDAILQPGTSTVVSIKTDPASSRGYSTRTYRAYLPTAYDMGNPLAVVLVFHDYGKNTQFAEKNTGFSQLAEQQQFIVVYPQGLFDGDSDQPFWASLGPVDYGIDDVLFVSNVLDDVQQKACVDPQRIYATGFSNGGGMVNLLACRLSGRIAAFAPIAGNYFSLPGGCRTSRPIALLEMHGTDDSQLPYDGTDASKNPTWPLPSVQSWLQEWARRNGCSLQSTLFLQTSTVTALRWSPCDSDVAIVHYRLEHAQHAWPQPIEGRSAAAIIWTFFQSYRLPLSIPLKKSYTAYGPAH
jgi:polyhydroxybutyrate depolymerase